MQTVFADEPPPATHVITLKEVETIVLEANHDVRIARSAVDGARAGVLQADTLPNPTLSWNAASLAPNSVGSGPLFSKRVDQIVRVDQTIERGGKRALRVGLANAQLAGKQLDLQDQRRQTLQLARGAYIDLLLAEQRLDVFGETRRAYASSLDAATKRVKAGDLASADLARFKVEVLKADTDADAALGDRAHAQLALATLLATDVDPSQLKTDGSWPEPIDAASRAATSFTAADIESRPDVASARKAVDAAVTSIDLAKSQRVRDITVGVQFERYPGFGGTGNTVGAGVSIPLFLGNDYRGDIAHAASDRDAAEEGAAKVREAALADVAGARADLDIAVRKIATYRNGLLDTAESAAKSADFAFSRGALGIMDLMDARRVLLATRLDALAAEADYARAVVAVAAATTRVAGPTTMGASR
jgi:cobalt-zinc-cadmium efflux system outer membrane protein